MTMMTCKYDQTYTLPVMSFTPPAHPCTYLGWNTDANAYSASYSERQQIRNLTSVDGYTFDFYAIWDYAPDLNCLTVILPYMKQKPVLLLRLSYFEQ